MNAGFDLNQVVDVAVTNAELAFTFVSSAILLPIINLRTRVYSRLDMYIVL
jgi:hypothetical protein